MVVSSGALPSSNEADSPKFQGEGMGASRRQESRQWPREPDLTFQIRARREETWTRFTITGFTSHMRWKSKPKMLLCGRGQAYIRTARSKRPISTSLEMQGDTGRGRGHRCATPELQQEYEEAEQRLQVQSKRREKDGGAKNGPGVEEQTG